MKLNLLNKDVLSIISGYSCELKLLSWVNDNFDKLDFDYLSENYNAYNLLKDNKKLIYWPFLCKNRNPDIIKDFIQKNIEYKNGDSVCWYHLSGNENATYLLKRYGLYENNEGELNIVFDEIVKNKNIKIYITHLSLLDKYGMSMKNRNFRDVIKNKNDVITKISINRFENDYIKRNIEGHDKAMLYFKYMCLNENKRMNKILEKYKEYINWENLSMNPERIDILEKNKDKLILENLAINHKAIHIIKELMDENKNNCQNKNNCKNEYKSKEYYCKNKNKLTHLFWKRLSSNKNAIDILKSHINMIEWVELSRNEEAIEILKNNQDKIVWREISRNKSIFKYNDKEILEELMKI